MNFKKILLSALGILLGLTVLFFVAWVALAGPVTVYRILQYGDTNVDDFSHYPGRELHPSVSPFRFAHSQQELQVPPATLPAEGSEGDLEALLEANDTLAFLVIQGEAILYERYFQGHTPASLSQLFSVSKSITSVLVGMAIEDGYFSGVDQPITDFIPELAGAGFSEVRLHHLLSMTSGTSYVENDNPFGEHVILNYTPDLEAEILAFKMEDQPGEVFRYKSGDNALLALALQRALGGESITAYTQRRMWTPLGMEDRGVWTIDHAGDGLEKTWCCLAASARDLAKVGRLTLNRGAWQGQPLLSEDWIVQSTQRGQISDSAWPGDFRQVGWWNYGYFWWLAGEQEGDYFAQGKDGQLLYLNPGQDIVVVRLGWSSGELRTSQWIGLFQRIAEGAGQAQRGVTLPALASKPRY